MVAKLILEHRQTYVFVNQLTNKILLLTVKDHASSNGCWVANSLGHGGESVGVTIDHQTDVLGLQLARRVADAHVVPHDDHVLLTLI